MFVASAVLGDASAALADEYVNTPSRNFVILLLPSCAISPAVASSKSIVRPSAKVKVARFPPGAISFFTGRGSFFVITGFSCVNQKKYEPTARSKAIAAAYGSHERRRLVMLRTGISDSRAMYALMRCCTRCSAASVSGDASGGR